MIHSPQEQLDQYDKKAITTMPSGALFFISQKRPIRETPTQRLEHMSRRLPENSCSPAWNDTFCACETG